MIKVGHMKEIDEIKKNNLVKKQSIQLVDIEFEITQVSLMMRKGWLLIGEKLLTIERNELYKQHNSKNMTKWLEEFSISLDVVPSTLWKFLKIVKMLNDINFPISEVNLKNVTGLEQIARIYEYTSDGEKTFELIKQLDEKVINITKIKKIASDLMNPKPAASDKNNNPATKGFLKAFWQKITKGFLACLTPKPIIKALPVLFVVFYITDMS